MRLSLATALVLSLAACGLWSRDTTEPPAPLPEFTALGSPMTLWSRSIGGSGDRYLWQVQPGVTDGLVVAADARGRVTALDRDSGSPRWETRLGDARISSGVGVGGGVAVVGTLDGEAIALNLENGDEIWRTQLSSELLGISAVAGGIVVARSNDGRLHALDAASGSVQWTVLRTTPALSLRGAQVPRMLPGRVLASFDNGRMLMLGAQRGNVLWEATLAVPSGRSDLERLIDADGHIPVYRGVAFATTYQGRLAAVTLDSGDLIWARDFSSYQGGDIHSDSEILVMTASDSHVWGLDPRNGGDLWQQRDLRLRGLTAPVVAGDQAVVGDYQGYLHWLNVRDGGIVARTRAGSGGIVSRPVLDDGVLYVLAANGQLSAIRARVGND
ncbi:outer membrane protein assembly factor BamB [Thioalkalivibrio paradoxus]|uniref:outer membrane protein assembly factor BamB n=1 Tax=Thioalkalivibrio paradoxus TaxID=108010 RepID=UPI00046C9F9F|nr:outer membrane protein assembly factor BamB [Thioalkalivibrio paradoxus]